jgi:serine phosphatase RsbU (regulator of sigma subunit)
MDFSDVLSVRELMLPNPFHVAPHMTVHDAVRLMNEQRIGALLVMDGRDLVGVFTERDLLRNAASVSGDWLQRPISEWMTREPWTISPQATWQQAVSLMETLHIRHVPVVDDGAVVGLVTSRGLMERHNEYLNREVQLRTRELREANHRLQERDAELRTHMLVAGKLQARLLPSKPIDLPEIGCATIYQPLDPLGGDYFAYARPSPDHVGLLIADASGHSIPAAMVAIMTRTAFVEVCHNTATPATVLSAMNRQLHGLTGEHFVTAFYGVFERQSRRLRFANAGQPMPYRYHAAHDRCEPLEARGLMLGILPEGSYDEFTVQLDPGDRLVLYTDGVIEGRDAELNPFGDERLIEAILEVKDQSAKTIAQHIADRLAEYRGDCPSSDDVTILAAEVR